MRWDLNEILRACFWWGQQTRFFSLNALSVWTYMQEIQLFNNRVKEVSFTHWVSEPVKAASVRSKQAKQVSKMSLTMQNAAERAKWVVRAKERSERSSGPLNLKARFSVTRNPPRESLFPASFGTWKKGFSIYSSFRKMGNTVIHWFVSQAMVEHPFS